MSLIYIYLLSRAIMEHVRRLDSTRPITMALARGSGEDRTVSISNLVYST